MSPMSDLEWNSIPVSEEEKPRVSIEELREMAEELDPDDFDEPVQEFLRELSLCEDVETLRPSATLLLQDEIDLSPELAEMGIEPDEALISLLLAVGADVNARNPYGQPPLHVAARYGYESIASLLLAAGADVRRRDSAGRYAADHASTPELASRLAPPLREGEEPLPPEIEDADYVPEGECPCHEHHHGEGECHCHEHHHGEGECHCHEHHHGEGECHCHGHHHDEGECHCHEHHHGEGECHCHEHHHGEGECHCHEHHHDEGECHCHGHHRPEGE